MKHLPQPVLLLALVLCASSCDPKSDAKPAVQGKLSFEEVDPLLKAHDVVPAIAKLEDLHERFGPDPMLTIRLARAYNAHGDQGKAVLLYKECVAKHPEVGSVWFDLANLYQQLGQLPAAREAYTKAREGKLGDKELAIPFGSCLGRLGELDLALAEFDRAEKAAVDPKFVQYNRGLVLLQKKEFGKAQACYVAALAIDPKYAEAKRELARSLLAELPLGKLVDEHNEVDGKPLLEPAQKAVVDRAMNLVWDAKDALGEDWHLSEIMGDGWLLLGDVDASVAAYTEALRIGHNPPQIDGKYRVAKKKQNDAAKKAAQAAGKDVPAPKPGVGFRLPK